MAASRPAAQTTAFPAPGNAPLLRNIFMTRSISRTGKQLTRAALYGAASLLLYFLLYLFEDKVMELAAHGRWYFIVPIVIAFVYSFAHGNFTAHFWDVLGIKAKK